MQRSMNKGRQADGVANGVNGDEQSNGDSHHYDVDAVIIGGGFAGVYLLYKLRKEGFNAKIVEAGTGLGGIWWWNNYPGARVDSQYPVYALSIPEVVNTWHWTEQYPGSAELQAYFKHMDKVLDISKDTLYETRVAAATWEDDDHKWHLKCDNGTTISARFMNCCLGFAAKRHFPDWPGYGDYKGYMCHSSFWPVDGVDMKGKKMAVIGQGATGIQIAQTAAREASELKVFIRTPNNALPMNQRSVDPEQAKKDLETIVDRLDRERYENQAGFLIYGENKSIWDDTEERREEVFRGFMKEGGFRPLFAYNDIMIDKDANRWVYDKWAQITRERIKDPVKRDILVPLEPPHPFAAKRPSLEQDYYEQMDKDHVELIDLKKNGISHFTPEGIVTKDGRHHEFDIIAMATGFDSLTGGFQEVDFTGINGETLEEKWGTDRGALSYLGMTVNGFPNMFYTYGPHAPTAYSNGPSCTQKQGDWITEVCKKMRAEDKTKINAKKDAEEKWKESVNKMHEVTLRHNVDSWYMGTNIPGKPRQVLNYAGGVPLYLKTIQEVLDKDLEGFEVS